MAMNEKGKSGRVKATNKVGARSTGRGSANHEKRITTLEKDVKALKAPRAFKAAMAAAKVDMVFTLDEKATTAKFARVYLEDDPNNDIANNMDKRTGVLKGRTVGSQINVVVDVSGSNSGAGVFNVTHGNPPSCAATVDDGPIRDQPIDVI